MRLGRAPAVVPGVKVGGYTYHVSGDGTSAEIWRTDGSTSAPVTNLAAEPQDLTIVGDRLFFTADDGIHGRELWQLDLRTLETSILKDLLPGPEGSNPAGLTAIDEGLVFAANDGLHGIEPWRWAEDEVLAEISQSFAYHNALQPADVNQDGIVTPLDALLVIVALNSRAARQLPVLRPLSDATPLVDSSGDGQLSPLDVLLVLVELRRLKSRADDQLPTPRATFLAEVAAFQVIPSFSSRHIMQVCACDAFIIF